MADIFRLGLYLSLWVTGGIVAAIVIYRKLTHDFGMRISSWDKGSENTPFAIMLRSCLVATGELHHWIWGNRKVIKDLEAKLESTNSKEMKIITSGIDYNTLIDSKTNKGTKILEWLVKGKIKIYRVSEEINFIHFRIIDDNIVVFHEYSTGKKGKEIIFKGIKPIVEKFKTKFEELLKEADGPFQGEDLINKFEIRKLKDLAKDEWRPLEEDERKILEREIDKLISVQPV